MPGRISHGVRVVSEPPDIEGTYSGSLIVLGSACGVWDDLRRARALAPRSDLMAVNLMFCAFKQAIIDKECHVEHWVSLHPEFFAIKNLYTGKFTKSHCFKDGKNVDYVWPCLSSGTSGMFAVRVGLMLGYESIILCGVPLENKPHIYDYPGTNLRWPEDKTTRKTWMDANREEFNGRVKSMSGNTRKWLGPPETEVKCGK